MFLSSFESYINEVKCAHTYVIEKKTVISNYIMVVDIDDILENQEKLKDQKYGHLKCQITRQKS